MPNIWKRIAHSKVEPYQFPSADELQDETLSQQEPEALEEEEPLDSEVDMLEEEEAEEPPAPAEPPADLVYAKIQAEQILQQAKEEADALLDSARVQAESFLANAHSEGFEAGQAEGLSQGRAKAQEEQEALQAQMVQEQAQQVEQFLKEANNALQRLLDESVGELRDLAIAVAEKVIGISLQSSSEVIERMIHIAVDKRKRCEWVHIYVSEQDAKRLVRISPMLAGSLSALSDHVRIVPMGDDEAGMCIIEMPDQIIDASASTQLDNIRSSLAEVSPDPVGATSEADSQEGLDNVSKYDPSGSPFGAL